MYLSINRLKVVLVDKILLIICLLRLSISENLFKVYLNRYSDNNCGYMGPGQLIFKFDGIWLFEKMVDLEVLI